MAQVRCNQIHLRHALLRIWTPAAGVRCISDMVRINFEKSLQYLTDRKEISVLAVAIMENVGLDVSLFAKRIQDNFGALIQKHFDNEAPYQLDVALLTGSWSEGLHLYNSASLDIPDMDFVCILKNISFSEMDQACGNLAVKENTPFVNAYITNLVLLKMWEDFLEDPIKDETKRQLSSRKLKARLYENHKNAGEIFHISEKSKIIGDGPSLEIKKELSFLNDDLRFLNMICPETKIEDPIDIVLSIRCDGWPCCALEWLQRDRLWPDRNLVQKICQDGFHIVPKSSPQGNFRLSFSNAETTLIENLTPLQHKVIRAFKAVIKFNQNNWSPNIKNIICSYYLKTIAFWHVEKTTQDSWTEDNVVSHLLSLIEEFAEALKKGNLPMYFLPKYNLLENVGNRGEMRNISRKVLELWGDISALTNAVEKLEKIYCIQHLPREMFKLLHLDVAKDDHVLNFLRISSVLHVDGNTEDACFVFPKLAIVLNYMNSIRHAENFISLD